MFATLVLLLATTAAAPDPPPSAEPLPVVLGFDLADAAGKKRSAAEWAGKKAVVLLFISTECPASNGYAPEMARLFKEFGDRGVLFYGVHSDEDLSAEQAAAHAHDHALSFPVLLDPRQSLAKLCGIKRAPSAVILSPEGRVLYRGRIDDRYLSLAKKRPEPTQRDVEEALNLVLSGKPPAAPETPVIGCLLPKLLEKPR